MLLILIFAPHFSCLQTYSIQLEGLTGRLAFDINGFYDPTSESSGGFPIYCKRHDPRRWLEYLPSLRRWQVKPASAKGVDACWAYLDFVEAKGKEIELLDIINTDIWVSKGKGVCWQEQPDAKLEVERGSNLLTISGFSGQHAKKVNGTYQ